MTGIQEWVDDVGVEVPSCLEATINRAVRYSMQEFFTESEAWRFSEMLTLVTDQTEYPLTLPAETYILAMDKATVGYSGQQYDLIRVADQELNAFAYGRPKEYTHTNISLIMDSVSEEAECQARVVLRPTHKVQEIPDELGDKHFETIRSGALMRLKSMTDKDWSDPQGAAKYAQMFSNGIHRAKREAKQTRSRVRKTAKFNSGFSW